MKKIFLVFATILSFALNVHAQILEPETVVKKIKDHFANVRGFKTSFIENNGSTTYRGELTYKSPNKFRMTYRSSNDNEFQSIYFNGQYLWIYLPRSGMVAEQRVNTNSETGSFYTKDGMNRLVSDYNFNFYKNIRELRPANSLKGEDLGIPGYDEKNSNNDSRLTYHMELTPKTSSTDKVGFTKIHLWVADNGVIVRVVGISTTQSIIEYWFYGMNYYEVYSDDLFNFVIPQGLLVLKDQLVN